MGQKSWRAKSNCKSNEEEVTLKDREVCAKAMA